MRKRTLIFVIAVIGALGLMANSARATTPPAKPFPLVQANVISNTPVGTTAWCGQDFVMLRLEAYGSDAVRLQLVRFSNESKSRPVKLFFYEVGYRSLGTATFSSDSKNSESAPFVDDPLGVWATHTFTVEDIMRVGFSPMTVTAVVIIRQKAQDCLLTREVFTGEKG